MIKKGDVVYSTQNKRKTKYKVLSVNGSLASISSLKEGLVCNNVPLKILILVNRTIICNLCELKVSSATTIEKKKVCNSCLKKHYDTCIECKKIVQKNYIRKFSVQQLDPKEQLISCFICYKKKFFGCEICGITVKKEAMSASTNICVPCYDLEEHPEFRGARRAFNYVPEVFNLKKIANEKTLLYAGIELECANIEHKRHNDVMSGLVIKNSNSFAYSVFDRSINNLPDTSIDVSRGDGIEIVTHPATFKFWKANKKLIEEGILFVKKQGFRSFDARQCGMHIHLSLDAFTSEGLTNFLLLFYSNKNMWTILSEKEKDTIKRYCTFYHTKDGLRAQGRNFSRNTNKYRAINVTRHTVEIRFLKGSLSYTYFMKNLEIAEAAYEFAHNRFFSENAKDFIKFVEKKGYDKLYAFMKEKLKVLHGFKTIF